MRTTFSILLLTSSSLAVEPVIRLNVPYTEPSNTRQTLDIYSFDKGRDRPVVFWIIGCDRENGDLPDSQNQCKTLHRQGFDVFSINFLLQPEATVKEMATQVATAIRWSRDHANDYGGDPIGILVGGNGVGAHLAALVCTDEDYLKAEGLPLDTIKGCIPMDGDTFDIPLRMAAEPTQISESLARRFGIAEEQKIMSPVTYITKGKYFPPFLIVQLAKNSLVEAQDRRLYEALKEAGIPAKVVAADGESYGLFASDMGLPMYSATYPVYGYVESIIRPRIFETFQVKLNKTLTPATAEAAFGTPNFVYGSGTMFYRYHCTNETVVTLNFIKRPPIDRERRPLWRVLDKAECVNKDGTVEVLPLK